MTTIIYSHEHQEVAFDSRASCGRDIATDDYNKLYKVGGAKFVVAGSVSDIEILLAMYADETIRAIPEVEAIMVEGGRVYQVSPTEEGELRFTPVTFNIGAGSGYQWALSALDHGATPRQAVKYATTKDSASGGKIRVIKVK